MSAFSGSTNLAPFSFTNVINYDPPLFTVGFTGCGIDDAKDTLKNLLETGECNFCCNTVFIIHAKPLTV